MGLADEMFAQYENPYRTKEEYAKDDEDKHGSSVELKEATTLEEFVIFGEGLHHSDDSPRGSKQGKEYIEGYKPDRSFGERLFNYFFDELEAFLRHYLRKKEHDVILQIGNGNLRHKGEDKNQAGEEGEEEVVRHGRSHEGELSVAKATNEEFEDVVQADSFLAWKIGSAKYDEGFLDLPFGDTPPSSNEFLEFLFHSYSPLPCLLHMDCFGIL